MRAPPRSCVSVVPSTSIPRREAEGEASIIINPVERTASSVRSCVAPASGSSSPGALEGENSKEP
jgi:hypothetical protein